MKKEDLVLDKTRIVEYNQKLILVDGSMQELNQWIVILNNGDEVSIISHWLGNICLSWGEEERPFEVLNYTTDGQKGYLTSSEVENFLKEMENK